MRARKINTCCFICFHHDDAVSCFLVIAIVHILDNSSDGDEDEDEEDACVGNGGGNENVPLLSPFVARSESCVSAVSVVVVGVSSRICLAGLGLLSTATALPSLLCFSSPRDRLRVDETTTAGFAGVVAGRGGGSGDASRGAAVGAPSGPSSKTVAASRIKSVGVHVSSNRSIMHS